MAKSVVSASCIDAQKSNLYTTKLGPRVRNMLISANSK